MNEEHFTFHLQYKHSGTIANRKYEEQSYPKKSENVRLHSSNSIENAPHYSQSSLENATPSSGTFPLTSYKAVPPPGQIVDFLGEMVAYQTIVLCGHVTSELSVTTMMTKTGKEAK